MNCGENDFEEIEDLRKEGWSPVNKHRVTLTPKAVVNVDNIAECNSTLSKN